MANRTQHPLSQETKSSFDRAELLSRCAGRSGRKGKRVAFSADQDLFRFPSNEH